MYLIAVIIRPYMLEEVRGALHSIGVNGLTLTEVKGFEREQGHTELYRGTAYRINFVPKIKLEIAADDTLVDQVIDAISGIVKIEHVDDGKLFITEIKQVFRIRTGDSGVFAL